MIPQFINKAFSSIFGGPGGDRQAKISDLNLLVDLINANSGSVNHVLAVSQSGTTKPSSKYMSTGDVDNCKSTCSSICTACDCQKGCSNEVASSTSFVWAYGGVGTYTLTGTFLGTAYAAGIFNAALFLSPPSAVNGSVAVTVSSNDAKTIWTWTIKTYAAADGTLTNGILNNMFADIRVFTS